MPQDPVIDQINNLLAENEKKGIAPNDGTGDFTAFVNTMEGNPNEIPLEIMQSKHRCRFIVCLHKNSRLYSSRLRTAI